MNVLPLMPKDLVQETNSVIHQFIWKDQRPRIRLDILTLNKDQGGLRVVNITAKDLALKVKSVFAYYQNEYIAALANKLLILGIQDFLWKANIRPNEVNKLSS